MPIPSLNPEEQFRSIAHLLANEIASLKFEAANKDTQIGVLAAQIQEQDRKIAELETAAKAHQEAPPQEAQTTSQEA